MAVQRTQFPAFVGPSYSTKSMPIDCQRSINWMPTPITSTSAKTRYALYPVPGYKHITFTYNGTDYDHLPSKYPGRIRGMYYTSKGFEGSALGALVVVAAESVFEVLPINADGKYELKKLGIVSNLEGMVTITDDGFGLIISDNTTLYHVNLTTRGMSSLGTDAPLQASSVTFLNGYTICVGKMNNIPSNSFFWSNQYANGRTDWDALNYASAEGFADPITCVTRVGGDLWLFGPRSYEVWQSADDMNLPFIRMSGSMGNIGCASAQAVSEIGDRVFFLGSGAMGTRKAFVSNGYNVQSISTDALEEEWTGYKSFDDAVAFAYTHEGNTYWCVTWLADNRTYCYCLESDSWHERATRNPLTDSFNKWRITQGVYAYDEIIVGDMEGTKLFNLSSDIYDEDGVQIVRMRRAPHMHDGMTMIRHASLTIEMETGMGTATGQGVNPQAMMRYSNDGGRTWSSELWLSAGAQGQYKTRCKWARLGQARDRVYELYCSDPVRWVVMGAELETEKAAGGV